MTIFAIIFLLSIVQSLFGVGILLFGTSILLILGYEYNIALLYLLPASAAISWSQVWDYKSVKLFGNYRKLFFTICLPALLVAMYAASYFDLKYQIKIFVVVMLFVAFVLRYSKNSLEKVQKILSSNLPFALGLMGIIHGLSNMGGSILTPLVSSLYKEKEKVLAGVSFDYAFMATFQLMYLFLVQKSEFKSEYLFGAAISLLVRYLIGKRVFAFTGERIYQYLLNGFILTNALLLVYTLI
ncbi:MAG: TSUP family transporter [Bacteriovoracaceae bacterium]